MKQDLVGCLKINNLQGLVVPRMRAKSLVTIGDYLYSLVRAQSKET